MLNKILSTIKMVLVVSLVPFTLSSSHPSWNYDPSSPAGPSQWGNLGFPDCNSGATVISPSQQNPLNIQTTAVLPVNTSDRIWIDSGSAANAMQYLVGNNGHAFVLGTYPSTSDNDAYHVPRIKGGVSSGMGIQWPDVTLVNVHYHTPAEHQVNGVQPVLERHMVFVRDNVPSGGESGDHGAPQPTTNAAYPTVAAVVISTMYVSANSSVNDDPILQALSPSLLDSLKQKGTEAQCVIDSSSLFGNSESEVTAFLHQPFYAFRGSFTTPPCTEPVLWLVASETLLRVTPSTLSKLQAPFATYGNARPIQSRNVPILTRLLSLYSFSQPSSPVIQQLQQTIDRQKKTILSMAFVIIVVSVSHFVLLSWLICRQCQEKKEDVVQKQDHRLKENAAPMIELSDRTEE